ncbi:MAG: phosphate ABC transporter permease subunit PstC, partial [Candidatus Micrarchaeota archaeon]|nr:phosphate ABC transporter permease subunit PstC [Candidatus Micrarchaeota archaeon]
MDRENLIRLFFKANGLVSVLLLAGIFAFLLWAGLGAFERIGLADFFGPLWNPTSYHLPVYGILGLLFGSVLVVASALLVAVPLGVFTAVYLSEMASPRMREFLKPTIELIASIPSVVLGLVGLLVLGPLVAGFFGISSGLNALTASLVVAVMLVPTIAS